VNGSFSRWVELLSAIPQGSILGPVLFVLFISDIPDRVKFNIYLFADDPKIFREIASLNYQDRLQQDLDSLQEWETKWLLRFNTQTCKMMTIRVEQTENIIWTIKQAKSAKGSHCRKSAKRRI